MSFFKETSPIEDAMKSDRPVGVDAPKLEESDIPKVDQRDVPHWMPADEIGDNSVSDLTDIFNSAFKSFGLAAEASEAKSSETAESSEGKDYSQYLEKGDDGKYYDKETGKAYDSVEDWVKAQETLAKRYEGTAQYFEEKAKREWARFKNAEENGESDAEKWEHYRESQKCYAKAKDCREKAEKIRDKIENTNDRSQIEESSDNIVENNNNQELAATQESRTFEGDNSIEVNEYSKEYQSIVNALEKEKVEYLQIQKAEKDRHPKEIISRISGGDMTEGSCSSLALAYAGNVAGYDVLDFRGGKSRSFFSLRSTVEMIAEIPEIKSTILEGTNDIEAARQLLSGLEDGKEYYLAVGNHAAIVRKCGDSFQYLELQHPSNGNGWQTLDDSILRQRFVCRDIRLQPCTSILMDVDSMANSPEFCRILGYINTDEGTQRKGESGNVQ